MGDASGSITADTVGRITVGGDLHDASFQINTGIDADNPLAYSLSKLAVAGIISNTNIHAAGNIGKVRAQEMHDSNIFAGINSATNALPDSADDFDVIATIRSFALTGEKATDQLEPTPLLSNSNIAASSIRAMKINGTVQTDNNSNAFGFATRNDVLRHIGPDAEDDYMLRVI